MAGGSKIDPTHYGYNNNYSNNIDTIRDEYDRKLFYSFNYYKKPILGICRGFQLILHEFLSINKYYKQFIKPVFNLNNHHQINELNIKRSDLFHSIKIDYKNLYNSTINLKNNMFVNSMHLQGFLISKYFISNNTFKILALSNNGTINKKYNILEAFKIFNFNSPILAVQ